MADRNLRIGLRLGAIGMASAAVGSIFRALYIVVAWAFGPVVKVLLLLGVPFVIVGGMLFLRRRHLPRRAGAGLGVAAAPPAPPRARGARLPCGRSWSEAFPSIVLRTPPRRRGDRLSPRGIHRVHYRRVIEIRDGLVQLSPYLDADFGEVVAADPAAAAAALKTALERHAAGEESDGHAKQVLPARRTTSNPTSGRCSRCRRRWRTGSDVDTLITAGRVLPRPSTPVRDGAVLVRDGVIVAAGPRADVVAQAAPDASRHDFPTGTALAGLFNVHVHLAFDASREMLAQLRSGTRRPAGRRALAASAMLRSGVTTVRDLGDRGHLGAAVRRSFDGCSRTAAARVRPADHRAGRALPLLRR